MNKFCDINVFNDCSLEELKLLYDESKRYEQFTDIPETSLLNKYKEKFLEISMYKSISVFYLVLTRTYIDKDKV